MDAESAAGTVKALLGAANITVSEAEFLDFAKSYPALRAQADGLYLPELEAVDPALSFDPTAD
ncbi:MAG TPA: hypothetical protein VHX59_24530 [Mycobacteriales bacterium]|jgi:hypothetical protein|nr:hypothetical protein [Mycobacteriales bacterium]